jgi:hypothetical protein
MAMDGCSLKEIEGKVFKIKEADAIKSLPTFGYAADKYKTEWVVSISMQN